MAAVFERPRARPGRRPAAGSAPARRRLPDAARRRRSDRNAIDLLEVGVARRFRMVGLEEAEERPRRLSARARARRAATGSSGRRPRAAGVRPAGPARDRSARCPGKAGRAAASHRWRRRSTLEAAVRDPRVRGALSEVLAAHHHRAAARHAGRRGGRRTARHRPRCS